MENVVCYGFELGEGGGEICIVLRDDGMYIEIIVEDDGVGMDFEGLRVIFIVGDDGLYVGFCNVDMWLC